MAVGPVQGGGMNMASSIRFNRPQQAQQTQQPRQTLRASASEPVRGTSSTPPADTNRSSEMRSNPRAASESFQKLSSPTETGKGQMIDLVG